jgi:WD40 repeat protein
MNPINQSTKIIRTISFTCLLAIALGACTPGSTVPPTVIPTSTAKPTLAPTATSISFPTFKPVPTSSPTSTSTPRPIPPVVECSDCKIAYIADSDGFPRLYTMKEDGSKPTLITPKDLDAVYGFALSPDGHRVAFQSGSQVYIMNLDGSNLVRLTQNLAFDGAPYRSSMSWSPDGSRIAFTLNIKFMWQMPMAPIGSTLVKIWFLTARLPGRQMAAKSLLWLPLSRVPWNSTPSMRMAPTRRLSPFWALPHRFLGRQMAASFFSSIANTVSAILFCF